MTSLKHKKATNDSEQIKQAACAIPQRDSWLAFSASTNETHKKPQGQIVFLQRLCEHTIGHESKHNHPTRA